MSYLGRKPIKIPTEVKAKIGENTLLIKGPLGSLKRNINKDISIQIDGENIVINKPIKKQSMPLWGLYRKLISNMIQGVYTGFSVQLAIVGVGYRAELNSFNNRILTLKLGFSHIINLNIPDGIDVSIIKTKKYTVLIFSGINNELVTQFASKVRDYRRPEPYKGKGLSYLNENIRKKEGKKK